MSDRYCAWIQIGGRIERADIGPLLEEIRQSDVKLHWGDAAFEPNSVDDLLKARIPDGWLELVDDGALNGEFEELEIACRQLGLGYRRACEAYGGYDPEIVDWRPDMDEPVVRKCSNENHRRILIDADDVKQALTALQAGRHRETLAKLESLCPEVPELAPFEIV